MILHKTYTLPVTARYHGNPYQQHTGPPGGCSGSAARSVLLSNVPPLSVNVLKNSEWKGGRHGWKPKDGDRTSPPPLVLGQTLSIAPRDSSGDTSFHSGHLPTSRWMTSCFIRAGRLLSPHVADRPADRSPTETRPSHEVPPGPQTFHSHPTSSLQSSQFNTLS